MAADACEIAPAPPRALLAACPESFVVISRLSGGIGRIEMDLIWIYFEDLRRGQVSHQNFRFYLSHSNTQVQKTAVSAAPPVYRFSHRGFALFGFCD